jgi:hypothetical protein
MNVVGINRAAVEHVERLSGRGRAALVHLLVTPMDTGTEKSDPRIFEFPVLRGVIA